MICWYQRLRSYGRLVGLVLIGICSNRVQKSDLVIFVMCTLVSRVHMTFHILTKGYIAPGNQGTYDKLNQIHKKAGIHIVGIFLMVH